MSTARNASVRAPLHSAHAFLLACTFPLFLGVLLNDWAYFTTYEIQWKNFASWLIVGALIFGGVALLWALITLVRVRGRGRPGATGPARRPWSTRPGSGWPSGSRSRRPACPWGRRCSGRAGV